MTDKKKEKKAEKSKKNTKPESKPVVNPSTEPIKVSIPETRQKPIESPKKVDRKDMIKKKFLEIVKDGPKKFDKGYYIDGSGCNGALKEATRDRDWETFS